MVARLVMDIQATSIRNELEFSTSSSLISSERLFLSDESILAFLCVRAWEKLPGSGTVD